MDIEPQKTKIGRFDQVRVITTKNIYFMSAPSGTPVAPDGIWSVVSVIGPSDLLCVKDNIVIRVPIQDVLKIGDYDVSKIYEKLGKLSHG
jgi:hypothetical protein